MIQTGVSKPKQSGEGIYLEGSRFFPVGRALQTGKGKELELILQYQTGIGSIKVNYGFQYTE